MLKTLSGITTVMRRLFNFIISCRSETENKWWHRLFLVLLFGSTIVIVVITAALSVSDINHPWITYGKPFVFSLEPNYQAIQGIELPCQENLFEFSVSPNEPVGNSAGIECNGINFSEVDSKYYYKLYETASNNLEKQFGLDRYFLNTCPNPPATGWAECFRKQIDAEKSDPNYIKYQNALDNLARIKLTRDFHIGTVFGDVALWLIIPIISVIFWIVFWDMIVYRSILYIIFGRQKDKNNLK